MNDDTLIPVSRGDEYLEVHMSALQNHIDLGWAACERREAADAPKPKTKKAAAEPAADATANKAED